MLSGISSSHSVGAVSATSGARSVAPVQPVQKVSPRPGEMERPEERGERAAVVNISDEARAQAARAAAGAPPSVEAEAQSFAETLAGSSRQSGQEQDLAAEGEVAGPPRAPAQAPPENPNELSPEEEQQVDDLRARDAEVRAHEQAHKSVGGQYAGSIHYDFQRGPDGQNYAIGGHVNIDVSTVPDDPAATVAKMQQVVRAALAPAEPSSADRQVAANASGKAAEARTQMAQERTEDVEARADESESGAVSGSTEETGPRAAAESRVAGQSFQEMFGQIATSGQSERRDPSARRAA